MQRYHDCPQILREFLIYHENIKGQSQLTISEYYLDLRMFFRFIKLMRSDMPIHTRLDDINIKDIDLGGAAVAEQMLQTTLYVYVASLCVGSVGGVV